MRGPEFGVVDTNVLVGASEPTRADHAAAQALITSDTRTLAVTPQVLREYLVVATRPAELNGLALSMEQAIANLNQFLDCFHVLPENAATVARLHQLVTEVSTSGRQIHDANIVATALAHGASSIITSDTRHFARFSDYLEIEELG